LLLVAALIWGVGFVAQRHGAEVFGPFGFTGIRFSLGALLLLPFILRPAPPVAGLDRAATRRLYLKWGGLAGLAMAIAATLQQAGMEATTAGHGGFITSLYVLFTPLLALAVGRRVGGEIWVACVLALVGLWLLSVEPSAEGFTVNPGDPLVLGCAFMWAIQILIVARAATVLEPLRFTFLQFAVTGILALAIALATEDPTLAQAGQAWGALLYGSVFSVCLAFVIQMVAQRVAPPTHAAIIMSLESVFGMAAGAWLLSEAIDGRKVLGGALMFVALLVAQLDPPWRKKRVPEGSSDLGPADKR
jgi:drug/metabolite transporter (DMT)-like permease